MSRIADQIIANGPYEGGARTAWLETALWDVAELNALREELIELRRLVRMTMTTLDRPTTGNPRCGWCVAEGSACPVHVFEATT